MSGAISATNGGALGQLIADGAASRRTLDGLTRQAGDGLISDTLGGLGGVSASLSASLGPAVARNQALQDGIDAASGRMQVAQTALTELSSIASSFYAQTETLNGLDPQSVQTVAADAKAALVRVAGLLDTQDGGTYVFAGTASDQPPIANPDAIGGSGFASQIAAMVAGLGTNGLSVAASARAVAASNVPGTSPFAPSATAATRAVVATGEGGQTVATGILAGANGDAVSAGAATTGSYSRDILAALATLGGLSGATAGAAGFADLIGSVRGSLGGAITALNTDAGILGDRQAALTTTKTELGLTQTALGNQVSGVQQVDMAATLSRLTQAQAQLSASYQLISSVQALSLTKFLSPGA